MFDAVKFDGDRITVGGDLTSIAECTKILGTYPVEVQYNNSEDQEFVVTSNESTGKLIVFSNKDGETVAIYISNDVETSCLVDLL